MSLSEDTSIGGPVIQFSVTDADGSTLRFSIKGGNDENKFNIDSKTG